MFPAEQIVIDHDGPVPKLRAHFDLTQPQLEALVAALDRLRRDRFGSRALDAGAVSELADLRVVSDQLELATRLDGPATVRVDADELRLLTDAVVEYLGSVPDDGYLPPDVRDRVELLNRMTGDLMDVSADLHAAHSRLDAGD